MKVQETEKTTMSSYKRHHLGEEMPYNHALQVLIALVYIVIWFLDSFIFQWSTFLRLFTPLLFHIIVGIIVIIIGILLMQRSHKALFAHEAPGLVTTGIFSHIRHPMYLGTLLVFLGCTIVTLSLLSVIPWLIAVILYDRMATYEEQKLEALLGDEYRAYKTRVPKWIPR